MNAIERLDRLILAGRRAGRQESARLLDSLLALPLETRWRRMLDRDRCLRRLSVGDYHLFIRSLAVNADLDACDLCADDARDNGGCVDAAGDGQAPSSRMLLSRLPAIRPQVINADGYRFRHERSVNSGTSADPWPLLAMVLLVSLAVFILVGLTFLGSSPQAADAGVVASRVTETDGVRRGRPSHVGSRAPARVQERMDLADRIDAHQRALAAVLRDLRTGVAFAQSMETIRKHLPDADTHAKFDAIAAWRDAGVPTLSLLGQRLMQLHKSFRTRTQDRTVIGSTVRLFRRLAGGLAPAQRRDDLVNRSLYRALTLLGRGELAQARRRVAEVAPILGPEAELWLRDANARLVATQLVRSLSPEPAHHSPLAPAVVTSVRPPIRSAARPTQ